MRALFVASRKDVKPEANFIRLFHSLGDSIPYYRLGYLWKGVEGKFNLRSETPTDDLARDDNGSSGSDGVVSIVQLEAEESFDAHTTTASPLEDTTVGSNEDMLEPANPLLVSGFTKANR